jgi:hypothetical protein
MLTNNCFNIGVVNYVLVPKFIVLVYDNLILSFLSLSLFLRNLFSM